MKRKMLKAKAAQIDDEAIARKAYELWEARGFPDGDPDSDWLAAEAHLRQGNGHSEKPKAKKAAAPKKTSAKKSSKS